MQFCQAKATETFRKHTEKYSLPISDHSLHTLLVLPVVGVITNNGQHQQRAYNATGSVWQLPGYGADKVQLIPSPGGE
ncbi:hypothetical protein [Xanthocytophaga flava]|uniref:hypothetical protein n=1 Tax=Xanthocytophaga flava TaxID=3048013 RepID=UPI0028D34037|nr:hypothetical protein [Xanthocytophaga flavus]MDJ1467989.1 hypothetical protein [Xanthocytophaga flavus]